MGPRSLSHRDRAILRAVAGGTAQLLVSAEPDLFLDGRCCSDQLAARRLAHAGLIAPPTPARPASGCRPSCPRPAASCWPAETRPARTRDDVRMRAGRFHFPFSTEVPPRSDRRTSGTPG